MIPSTVRFQGIYHLQFKNTGDWKPEETSNPQKNSSAPYDASAIEGVLDALRAENPETACRWKRGFGYQVFRNDICGDHFSPVARREEEVKQASKAYSQRAEELGTDAFSFSLRYAQIDNSNVDDDTFKALLPCYQAYEKAVDERSAFVDAMIEAGPVQTLWVTPTPHKPANPEQN